MNSFSKDFDDRYVLHLARLGITRQDGSDLVCMYGVEKVNFKWLG